MAERDQWERDKAEIRARIKLDGEVVALNVGGTHHMMTERDILMQCKGSLLERMFSGLHELKIIDDEVFLDRDGKTFQHLVNYLRNDRQLLPEFLDPNDERQFMKECEYWGVRVNEHGSARRSQVHNTSSPIRHHSLSFSYPKVVNVT